MAFNPLSSAKPKPLREVKRQFADERAMLGEYLALRISLDELFDNVFLAYHRYLVFYLRRRGWSAAHSEDLLQTAWVTLWRDIKRGTFFERGSDAEKTPAAKPILTFMIKTCEFAGRNLYRHENNHPTRSLEEPEIADSLAFENKIEDEICLSDVRRLIFRFCTEDEKRVLNLLAFGLDRTEIAEIVGEKPHWVDNRRRAAAQKIREAMKKTPKSAK